MFAKNANTALMFGRSFRQNLNQSALSAEENSGKSSDSSGLLSRGLVFIEQIPETLVHRDQLLHRRVPNS